MIISSSSKDKFFEKVINPYLPEVMKHLPSIDMHEVVLHIRDVQGPKTEGSEKARLAAVEQEILECQVMVECGLSANHSMIMDFIHENKMDTKNVGEALFKLQERIEHLQAQMFDLQNQKCEYESTFKRMSIGADFRILETRFSFYDGAMPLSHALGSLPPMLSLHGEPI
ncbi:40S ribosomal protein S5-1 [Hordeum vulgare]|nr:40S ribosomal protein S5-1 [Hordeum vulgare]